MKLSKNQSAIKALQVLEVTQLNEEALNNAHNIFCNNEIYPEYEENRHVLKMFEKEFKCSVSFAYDVNSGWARIINCSLNVVPHRIYGLELQKFFLEEYPHLLEDGEIMTGWYLDNYILSPIREFVKNPRNITLIDLMHKCVNTWVEACSQDMKEFYLKENFIELAQSNGMVFFTDGTRVSTHLLQNIFDI